MVGDGLGVSTIVATQRLEELGQKKTGSVSAKTPNVSVRLC